MPGQDEWLDTEAEEKFGRLRWLAPDDAVTPSALEAAPPAPGEPDQDSERRGAAEPPPDGAEAVGRRVGVWWIDDAQFYTGIVRDYDRGTGALPVYQAFSCDHMVLSEGLALIASYSIGHAVARQWHMRMPFSES